MSHSKTIMKIYELVNREISQLETIRDYERELSKEELEHYDLCNQFFSLCRQSPYFVEPQRNEDGTINFNIVTTEWIQKMLEDNKITNRKLAKGVNVTDSQISDWLSGKRNPSGPSQAAIFYYFQDIISK